MNDHKNLSKFLVHINTDGSISVINEKHQYSCFFESDDSISEEDYRLNEMSILLESPIINIEEIRYMLLMLREMSRKMPVNRFMCWYDPDQNEYHLQTVETIDG